MYSQSKWILLAWFVSFLACSHVEKEELTNEIILEEINLDNVQTKKTQIEDIIEINKIVELETAENALIEEITKLIVTNNRIIVFEHDLGNARRFFIFDHTGKFIRKVEGSLNRGPGSFFSATDILYDNLRNRIEILDHLQKKILYFDLDGNLKKEVSIPSEYTSNFGKFLSNNIYIGYKNNNFGYQNKSTRFNLHYLNENGERIGDRFYPIRTYLLNTNIDREVFFPYTDSFAGESFIFNEIFNDTLYVCNSNSVLPKFLIKVPNGRVPSAKLDELAANANPLTDDYYGKLLHLVNTKDVVSKLDYLLFYKTKFTFSFQYQDKSFWYEYDLINKEKSGISIKIDDPYFPLIKRPKSTYKDFFVFYIQPNEMNAMRSNASTRKGIEKIFETNSKFDEINNPIIVFAKLRFK